jgi:DNA anti-recombination protein RmuC
MSMAENNDVEVSQERRYGLAVDAHGGAVVDPTKNVLDLVRAESKYQDAMRSATEKHLEGMMSGIKERFNILTTGLETFQNAQRVGETNRIDQLAETRQEFQNTIRDMLAESVRTTSTLVSTQLIQIQATFDTRVTKLEVYQFTQAGKSSVSDPQMSDTLTRVTRDLAELKIAQDSALRRISDSFAAIQSGESMTMGTTKGKQESSTRLIAIVAIIAAVATPLVSLMIAVILHTH